MELTNYEMKVLGALAAAAGEDDIAKKCADIMRERAAEAERRSTRLWDDIGWLTGTGRFSQG